MDISNSLLNLATYKSRKLLEPTGSTTETTNGANVDNTNESESVAAARSGSDLNVINAKEMTYNDIKTAIYKMSHPNLTEITSIDTAKTYGANFNAICLKLGIGPNSTIKKADLTKLTRNDTEEDANHDLFGALNRAFSYLGPNDNISYNDLMLFFMRGAGNDGEMNFIEYQTVVNKYSEIVQQQYEDCPTPQAKLEFVIQKTKDYLTESRMDLQLAALNRLTTEPCASQNEPKAGTKYRGYKNAVDQIANVGQIAFADLGGATNGIITLGSYTTTSGHKVKEKFIPPSANTNEGSYPIMWAGDADYADEEDHNWVDGGLTLNSQYYLGSNTKWYEIVETLVHELTHATAFYYYDVSDGKINFSIEGLNFMEKQGFLDPNKEYNDENYDELIYLVNSMWHEWAAYTTSCNYKDSIAEDVFDSSDLATFGEKEQRAIASHLEQTGYNGTHADSDTYIVPDPMKYYGWDYKTFENMFYFDLQA